MRLHCLMKLAPYSQTRPPLSQDDPFAGNSLGQPPIAPSVDALASLAARSSPESAPPLEDEAMPPHAVSDMDARTHTVALSTIASEAAVGRAIPGAATMPTGSRWRTVCIAACPERGEARVVWRARVCMSCAHRARSEREIRERVGLWGGVGFAHGATRWRNHASRKSRSRPHESSAQ